jgi:hypothetical protein
MKRLVDVNAIVRASLLFYLYEPTRRVTGGPGRRVNRAGAPQRDDDIKPDWTAFVPRRRGLSVFYSRYVWHAFLGAAHLTIRGKWRSLERDASTSTKTISALIPPNRLEPLRELICAYAATRWSRRASNTVPSRHKA